MFSFKRKLTIRVIGALVSLAIMVITFFATDGLLGDKAFSEYTREDWSVAMLPLSIILLSFISTWLFLMPMLISMILVYPSLMEYVTKIKFSDIDSKTNFIVFDNNEFKRACCEVDEEIGLWISIKEYHLKSRRWVVLEKSRYIKNADDLVLILKRDYGYDKVKFYGVTFPYFMMK